MKEPLLVAAADQATAVSYRARLAGRGYRVETAVGVEECLRKFHEAVPLLAVIDLELAQVGAGQLLLQIRKDADLVDVPVVVIAAVIPVGALHQLPSSPSTRYVSRPSRLEDLGECIDAILNQLRPGGGPQRAASSRLPPGNQPPATDARELRETELGRQRNGRPDPVAHRHASRRCRVRHPRGRRACHIA